MTASPIFLLSAAVNLMEGESGPVFLPYAALLRIAAADGVSVKETMIRLLTQNIWPERFRRNYGLLSASNQARLLSMRFFIAGCGGLGGEVAELLARMGAGSLCLCDPDVFEESNLNRQRFCATTNIGEPKVLETKAGLLQIAPYMDIDVHAEAADINNLPRFLEGCDMAVDCLDSVQAAKMLENAASVSGIAYLHGSVLGHEGFAYLDSPGAARLEALYPQCQESGAGNVLAPLVSCLGAIMCSLVVTHLGRGMAASQLLHVDCSAFSIEKYDVL